MNDRVVASMHSSGVQLELTALAWRRTSLSVMSGIATLRVCRRRFLRGHRNR